MESKRFCLCIPTYKRPELLEKLIMDVSHQTMQPQVIIVVDGNPGSGTVLKMLKRLSMPRSWAVLYIPSNYGNKPYQMYLGWASAKKYQSEILLYLDDDLRIFQPNALEKTITPIIKDDNVVGSSALTTTGNIDKLKDTGVLIDRRQWNETKKPVLVRWFGSCKNITPGNLGITGHGTIPQNQGNDYELVQWFSGRVMAFRMDALSNECFSPDLFALFSLGYGGTGEDKFISRRVGSNGRLLFAFCASFHHPDDDLPTAYSHKPFRFGYAIAHSRRLLNDDCRVFKSPYFSDRLALVKSYIGTSLLNWWRAFTAPKRHRFAYAWGYTLGAFRGLIQKPTAENLTPQINWRQDAEAALRHASIIQEGSNG
ncbi:MAG: glycosyltransferase family 2 protein [Firmicutes bacterium]|nr:glycosyltransferase family 2 protein [Bacillota bacterium]